MSQPTAVKPYRWLAEYYDAIFSPARAPLDAARDRILGPILDRVEVACDLACGTGDTALKLAGRGVRMYAVDQSPGMCRAARRKAAEAAVPLRVLRADMRSFRPPEPVDLILCEGDAVNHVAHKADLHRVAASVARALRPDGWFYFDVNNRTGFERYWTGNVWLEVPKAVLVIRNGHSADAARAWSDMEWFLREGKLWRRHRERIEEVCWTGAEIREVLRDAGFTRVRSFDAAPFFPNTPVGRGCRTIYLARK